MEVYRYWYCEIRGEEAINVVGTVKMVYWEEEIGRGKRKIVFFKSQRYKEKIIVNKQYGRI